MKIHLISFVILSSFICLMTSCSESSSKHTNITERDVQVIMREVEKANVGRDSTGVAKYLAPFVVITVEMETPAGPQRVQMSRDRYISELQKVFAKMKSYDYKRENTVIKIRDDGKTATVETDVIEDIVLEGMEKKTITHEKAVLEIIDGQIVVTILDASVKART